MSEEQKKPSKALVIVLSIVGAFLLIPVLYYLLVIPRQKILDLKTGFVEVEVTKDGVKYTPTQKKPKNWVLHSEVNYVALHAIVVSEDWLFYEHKGYDLEQMKKALEDTVEKGEKLRGASTISQQVVKNLYLTQERSFLRKFNELIFSVYMERHLSKAKILEIYMNIVEFGPELYGIKPASQKYFQKLPKDLSPREGAFLAMLLPNPKKYSQSFRQKKLTDYAQATIDEILEKMVVAGYLKREDLEEARKKMFSWDTGEASIPGTDEGETKAGTITAPSNNEQKVELQQHKSEDKLTKKKTTKKMRKKNNGGSDYVPDSDLQLEDNPEFDKDAIIEDTSGLDEEFSLE